MHSLEAELGELARGPEVERAIHLAMELETGRVFSLRRELLVLLYASTAAVMAGVGLLIRDNLDRIGPAALLAGILGASALCYGLALRVKLQGRPRSLGLDYVLLLGALLFSAAIGYAEVQFHWLGARWSLYLLLLSAWHLLAAYYFDSRLVLSVALTTFAGWLGVSAPRDLFAAGWRSLVCAAVYFAAGQAHRRARWRTAVAEVYEQFALHLGFWGALALGFDPPTRWVGVAILLPLTWFVARAGVAQRRESFVLGAVAYATFGAIALEAVLLRSPLLVSNLGLVTLGIAVVVLMRLRSRLKDSAP